MVVLGGGRFLMSEVPLYGAWWGGAQGGEGVAARGVGVGSGIIYLEIKGAKIFGIKGASRGCGRDAG